MKIICISEAKNFICMGNKSILLCSLETGSIKLNVRIVCMCVLVFTLGRLLPPRFSNLSMRHLPFCYICYMVTLEVGGRMASDL